MYIQWQKERTPYVLGIIWTYIRIRMYQQTNCVHFCDALNTLQASFHIILVRLELGSKYHIHRRHTLAPSAHSFSCPFCRSTVGAAPPAACLLGYPLKRGWCHGWRVWHCRHWQGVDECGGQNYCRVLLALAWIRGEKLCVVGVSGGRNGTSRWNVQDAFMHSTICWEQFTFIYTYVRMYVCSKRVHLYKWSKWLLIFSLMCHTFRL